MFRGYSKLPICTKRSCRVIKKIKQISSGSVNHFGDFCRHSFKTWPNFSKFLPMSILSFCNSRQQETVSMPTYSLKNKSGAFILGIQMMPRHVLTFLKNYKQCGDIASKPETIYLSFISVWAYGIVVLGYNILLLQLIHYPVVLYLLVLTSR